MWSSAAGSRRRAVVSGGFSSSTINKIIYIYYVFDLTETIRFFKFDRIFCLPLSVLSVNPALNHYGEQAWSKIGQEINYFNMQVCNIHRVIKLRRHAVCVAVYVSLISKGR